jgi:rod shape-determining protein MreD
MSARQHGNGMLVIALTFCLALLLTILPLPEWARPFRPQWVALVLIYWCIALPHRIGVGSAFISGIALDVLTGTLLGFHSGGLAVLAFMAIQTHQRIRVFPLWQQSMGVFALLFIPHLTELWVLGATQGILPETTYWAVPVIGALLWPWVFTTLRDIRRRFKVR